MAFSSVFLKARNLFSLINVKCDLPEKRIVAWNKKTHDSVSQCIFLCLESVWLCLRMKTFCVVQKEVPIPIPDYSIFISVQRTVISCMI